jgi:hypothetical protein
MGRTRHNRSSRVLRRGLSRRYGRLAVGLTALALAFAFLASYAGAQESGVSVAVEDAQSLEGSPGAVDHTVAVPLRLSAASTTVVTVDWTTVDGTARIDQGDYDGNSGTVRFEPGDTTEFVEINIDGGNTPEWDEYFTIFLRNPAGATIARAFGKVTIIDDDGRPLGVDPGQASVAPAEGEGQCVTLKNGAGCQPLDQDQLVNLEDVLYINPGSGRVEIRSGAGVVAFYGGRFGVDEAAATTSKPVTVVRLAGGNFRQCDTGNRSLAQKGGAPVRRLWGKGKGRYRTRGRYSSGTVRGTSWITEDFCDGTRTRVFFGTVRVFDFVTKKTIVVKAGQSYFARAGEID